MEKMYDLNFKAAGRSPHLYSGLKSLKKVPFYYRAIGGYSSVQCSSCYQIGFLKTLVIDDVFEIIWLSFIAL
jgi:hypothetical protein